MSCAPHPQRQHAKKKKAEHGAGLSPRPPEDCAACPHGSMVQLGLVLILSLFVDSKYLSHKQTHIIFICSGSVHCTLSLGSGSHALDLDSDP